MDLSVGIIGIRFSEKQVAVRNAIVFGYTYTKTCCVWIRHGLEVPRGLFPVIHCPLSNVCYRCTGEYG